MSYQESQKRLHEATLLVHGLCPSTFDTKVEKAKLLMDLAELEMQVSMAMGERSLPKIPEPEDSRPRGW